MKIDDDKWRPSAEEFGVGFLADGKLNVVTPAEHAQRVAERNAEEALDSDDDTDDLDDLDAAFT